MSVKFGLDDSYRNKHNGALQSYRPFKALKLFIERRNSLLENDPLNNNKLQSASWSNSTPQNIELKLTVRKLNKLNICKLVIMKWLLYYKIR